LRWIPEQVKGIPSLGRRVIECLTCRRRLQVFLLQISLDRGGLGGIHPRQDSVVDFPGPGNEEKEDAHEGLMFPSRLKGPGFSSGLSFISGFSVRLRSRLGGGGSLASSLGRKESKDKNQETSFADSSRVHGFPLTVLAGTRNISRRGRRFRKKCWGDWMDPFPSSSQGRSVCRDEKSIEMP